jgi:hypothetical protein
MRMKLGSKPRKSPPLLVRQTRDGAWELVGCPADLPNRYETREAAIRAIELTADERWQVHAVAAARDPGRRTVNYSDVMWTMAARPQAGDRGSAQSVAANPSGPSS